MKQATLIYTCPDCSSERVTTEHHQMFMVNTGDHWCHSMKVHDSDSPATCLDCRWQGERRHLVTSTENGTST